ncbi:MAG: hypothetical protein Q4G30_03170 [Actinomycetaceae bacterium]|nr:hypothetical protein [Actinomycetaceae bacterium]
MNTEVFLSVFDKNSGRVAHNMLPRTLAAAVRPWFKDLHDERVADALNDLEGGDLLQQRASLDFLGLDVVKTEMVGAAA